LCVPTVTLVTQVPLALFTSVHKRAWKKSVHWIKQRSHVWNWLAFEQNYTSWIQNYAVSQCPQRKTSTLFRFLQYFAVNMTFTESDTSGTIWLDQKNSYCMRSISVMTLGHSRWYWGLFS
jgi:transposase